MSLLLSWTLGRDSQRPVGSSSRRRGVAVAPGGGGSGRGVTPQGLGIHARSSFTQALLPGDLVGIRGLKMTSRRLASPGWVGRPCSVLP